MNIALLPVFLFGGFLRASFCFSLSSEEFTVVFMLSVANVPLVFGEFSVFGESPFTLFSLEDSSSLLSSRTLFFFVFRLFFIGESFPLVLPFVMPSFLGLINGKKVTF